MTDKNFHSPIAEMQNLMNRGVDFKIGLDLVGGGQISDVRVLHTTTEWIKIRSEDGLVAWVQLRKIVALRIDEVET